MPVTNGVGHSWVTPDKQDGLSAILAQQLATVKAILRKRPNDPKKFIYIDAYAGCGVNGNDGTPGSPVVFERVADQVGNIDFDAYAVELREDNAAKLRGAVSRRTQVVCGDCSDLVPSIVQNIERGSRWSYGIFYADPNYIPKRSAIEAVAQSLPRVDILLRLPAAALKRNGESIADICSISTNSKLKANWLIREPLSSDKFQWVFMFGTNFSGQQAWTSKRFYPVNAPKGEAILHRMCTSAKQEQVATQLNFLDHPINVARQRSSGVCERCGSASASEPHHLRYDKNETADDIKFLCHACHCQAHGKAS